MKIISILLISEEFSPHVERCHVLKLWELGFMDCVNHYPRMYLRGWTAKFGGSCPCNDITIMPMRFNRNLERVNMYTSCVYVFVLLIIVQFYIYIFTETM